MNKQLSSSKNEVKIWIERLSTSERHYDKYHHLVEETRNYYKDQTPDFIKAGRYNIFWSSVETLKPFLYFKQPKPYIERQNKDSNPVETLACRILEKALAWNMEQFDFDSVLKYARNDFLISGMGLVWEQYIPEFQTIPDIENPEKEIEVKVGERVETIYVDPADFIADCDKVGIWEDVTWIAKKIYLSKQEAIELFGEHIAPFIVRQDERDYAKKDVCIYEIWDKTSQKVYWLCKEYYSDFLKVIDNPLGLKGFFPCPKPIFATMTNNSIIPTSDYSMIKEMLAELDGINNRMRLTMKALKVSGCYDNSFPELKSILNKDITLVSLNDFQKLKDNGGIRGIIDFMPVEQYVAALEQLAARRQDIIAKIFDVTGVSDIMRGSSDPKDTATAVREKTNFGTLRNQDRQNDMQRFIGDLFKIKAEIICERFSEETLLGFLSSEELQNMALAKDAVRLLKTKHLRGMVLGVETDIVFQQEQEAAQTLDGINTINEMINAAFQTVSSQPLLLPLYRQMIMSVVVTMPKSRQFAATVEKVFKDIEQELNKPEEAAQPNEALVLEKEKTAMQYQLEREKNDLKAKELQLKEQAEQNKLYLTNKEMEMQAQLKAAQIDKTPDKNTSSVSFGDNAGNISSGFVKEF